jgi:DNA ligase D-like protein (predicted 3'-phosphoesterase)
MELVGSQNIFILLFSYDFMSLTQYIKKRNLKVSKEPKAVVEKSKSKKLSFVIHEHHARNLHWDLRLEHNGALKSWAVPKEPPMDEKTKRLAIQVEDHPYSYKDFEGTIAEGNYGAGTVKIWDKGEYKAEKFSEKEIIVNFHGKKLKGKYVLIKTSFSKNSWLFFKKKD